MYQLSDLRDVLVRLRPESYPSCKSPVRQTIGTNMLLADSSPTDHIRTERIVATGIRNQRPSVPEEREIGTGMNYKKTIGIL